MALYSRASTSLSYRKSPPGTRDSQLFGKHFLLHVLFLSFSRYSFIVQYFFRSGRKSQPNPTFSDHVSKLPTMLVYIGERGEYNRERNRGALVAKPQ